MAATVQAEQEEPTFVLRGNDRLAGDVIARWLQMASARGVNDRKLEAARQALIRFDQWKKASPHTMKLPD